MSDRRKSAADKQPGESTGPYTFVKLLGEGTFSKVYLVEKSPTAEGEEPQQFALKYWKDGSKTGSKSQFIGEREALKAVQGVPCICQLADIDNDNNEWMVFDLLGENLGNLRKQAKGSRFSWPTTAAIGGKMLRCIEAVHRQGYVHRDIKPGNFLVGLGAASREVFLIDFGLAKACFRDGVHVPQRVSSQDQSARDFRGSAKYASHHTHRGEDVGRRDDLWCWFYSLVYCLEGRLPWEQDKDSAVIVQKKLACLEHPEDLTWHPRLQVIQSYLKGLQFDSEPDYDFIGKILDLEGPYAAEPYDWESPAPLSPGRVSGKRPREEDVLGASMGSRAHEAERVLLQQVAQRMFELHDVERLAVLFRVGDDICEKGRSGDQRYRKVLNDLKGYFNALD